MNSNTLTFYYSGGSAVSPSRRIVAVINMLDGIDVYDIARARLVKTIEYDLAELYMMDICFLNEDRLVSGYSRGTLVIVDCSRSTSMIPIMIEGVNIDRKYIKPSVFFRD